MNTAFQTFGWSLFILSSLTVLLWLMLARPSLPEAGSTELLVNKDNLYQHVKTLSVDYSPRDYLNTNNLNSSAEYIKEQFKRIGYQPIEQKFLVNDIEYKNIVINTGPESGPKLVIGAHYDTAGPYPGADDNASGIAGLIELSRLLKGDQLNTPITLVAYTLEEPPYFATSEMGSFFHAKSEKAQGSDIELMISLEMIGYFSEEENSQRFPSSLLKLFYPNRGNFIAVIDQLVSNKARSVKTEMAKNMSLPVHSMNAPAFIAGVDFSDHLNYWKHGYDAVMITDTSFYRNPYYHTEDDTIEHLDFDKMGQVVQGVYGFVKHYNNQMKQ